MANRTVLVDNNTWNNTHIATVGRAMASPEKKAWEIYRALDVTHVLVIFGGFIGWGPAAARTLSSLDEPFFMGNAGSASEAHVLQGLQVPCW